MEGEQPPRLSRLEFEEMVEGLGISADEHPPRRLLLDLPSVDPALNFSRIAEALADIIVRSEPHFALGLFGGWGSGKTTLMRAIEQRLRRSNVVCVQFNAWRYEKEEHLLIPLLDTIRDALVDWGSTQADDSLAQRTATRIGQVARTLVAGTTISRAFPARWSSPTTPVASSRRRAGAAPRGETPSRTAAPARSTTPASGHSRAPSTTS
jgi:Cdc6-like AAA superfamily ATPase